MEDLYDGEEIMEEGNDEEGEEKEVQVSRKVYVPGKSKVGKDETTEELEYDPSAYRYLHRFTTEYPCLSLDTLQLRPSPNTAYPVAVTFVAGTQAEQTRKNAIIVGRLGNVYGRKEDVPSDNEEDDESESESEEEEEDKQTATPSTTSKKPQFRVSSIPHHGGVNRVRATALGGSAAHIAAIWNEAGKVQLWNLGAALAALDATNPTPLKEKPLYTFPGHQIEGFALDWSRAKEGRLASGDNRGRIFTWDMGEGATWTVNQLPLTGHTSSVEDLQWSPSEENVTSSALPLSSQVVIKGYPLKVLASCSSDKSIRLWDVRIKPQEANVVKVLDAHESDVNVLSWNGGESLLLSGGDDGLLKVWELGSLQYGEPAAVLSQHTGPITSVSWCRGPEGGGTVLAASAEDDQVSIWDIAVEADSGMGGGGEEEGDEAGLPPQLLFLHMGQKEIKEIAWATDSPGALLTTACDGFNFLRTISV